MVGRYERTSAASIRLVGSGSSASSGPATCNTADATRGQGEVDGPKADDGVP